MKNYQSAPKSWLVNLSILALLTVSCSPSEQDKTDNSPIAPIHQSESQNEIIAFQTAGMIFSGGPIYTAIDATPTVEAVAVRDNMIIAAGAKDTIMELADEQTKMIDLQGAAMYPGFTDAHGHLFGIGMRELTLNLEGIESIASLVEAVRGPVLALEPGVSLYGRGWIETGWPEARFPNAGDLDRVSPNNPVILERADGHSMVVNSAALKKAGIDATTPNPSGGIIEKNTNGNPTGILIDAAQNLVSNLLDAPSENLKSEAYETASQVYAAYGWTGIHNMSVSPLDLNIMKRLADEKDPNEINKLSIRVYNSLDAIGLDDLEKSGPQIDKTGKIITRAIKLYSDGALGSRGALLFDPYADKQETTGLLLIEPVLDWYEEVYNAKKGSLSSEFNPRFRIEHSQIVRPSDIDRFAKNSIIASMQPSHAIGDLHFAPDRLGPERLEGAYAWRSMIDAGVVIAAGSDAPVERGDPRIEFYASIARKDVNGYQDDNWHPEEAVTRQEALKMFTAWPAYASFQENKLGTISPGRYADFTIFSKDIMTIDPSEILTVETVMTIVNGEIIYQK